MSNNGHGSYEYRCLRLSDEASEWESVPSVELVDVVSGQRPEQPTFVKAGWNDRSLSVRFECRDDYQVATRVQRDDPIYNEDVVEIFISESEEGRNYLEFEVSPRNVVFDAIIDNDLAGTFQVNEKWNALGLETSVQAVKENVYIYEITIPFSNFKSEPIPGTVWFINFFRIDEDRGGKRSYQAWSPTGKVNFHEPQCFGKLIFISR